MTTLLRAENLEKSFGGGGWIRRTQPVQAVRGLSLHVKIGETVGLVGESGSGKSTIGRMLLGMLPPSAGQVVFDGHDLAELDREALRRLRRRMQLVFQDPYASLDPRRAVGVQIADGLAIHGLAERAERTQRVAALLHQVGLAPELASRYPHEFSGGQRQRISIARALATGPDFLVADEPVSALDVSIQAQIIRLLAELRRDLNLAMLFISHDLPVVRALCDRVIVLYLGRIMEQGPATEVFARPGHPYTRALLSAAPRLEPLSGQRIVLSGDPPSPSAPPSGCVFRTRCPAVLPECAVAVPPLRDLSPGHQMACIRTDL